jgi:cation diffusion facilitator family transporter
MTTSPTAPTKRDSLKRFAWLSIGAALATMGLKTGAWALTGSVGLLSDAVESLVNLAGGVTALAMLTISARPADDDHHFGHGKAEYFASLTEGVLILVAAAAIAYQAIGRLLAPAPLDRLEFGLLISLVASAINFFVSRTLMRAGREHRSIVLEADAAHLMTDVWTSAGVIVGVGLVALTGWQRFDPIVALIIAANIVWTAIGLMRRSVDGLMDVALPAHEHDAIESVMTNYRGRGIAFHELRTRQSAARRFVSVHMLVPGAWSVHDAHHVAEDFESEVRTALGDATVVTHLEPIEDEISMHDGDAR